ARNRRAKRTRQPNGIRAREQLRGFIREDWLYWRWMELDKCAGSDCEWDDSSHPTTPVLRAGIRDTETDGQPDQPDAGRLNSRVEPWIHAKRHLGPKYPQEEGQDDVARVRIQRVLAEGDEEPAHSASDRPPGQRYQLKEKT